MTDQRAFALLVKGDALRPMGNELLVVDPIVDEGRRRGFDVGVFDLTTLTDPYDAPGVWFDHDGSPGRLGRYEVPHVVHDRHLGGVAGDHPRRLALARSRRIFNSPAIQTVTVDKLNAGRVLRHAGVPVPAEVVGRRPWSTATIDKPRFGSRGSGVRVDRGGLRGWIRRRRRDDAAEVRVRQDFVEPVPFRGRHPHIKVHVQRETDGALVVAHAAARYWASGNSRSADVLAAVEPVSHYEAVIPSAVVRDESLETAVERLSLQAASAIETVDDSLFELGVDIVVGKTQGLVVIEVNSKPGHSSYHQLAKMEELPVEVRREARDQERASFRRIVDEVERRVG